MGYRAVGNGGKGEDRRMTATSEVCSGLRNRAVKSLVLFISTRRGRELGALTDKAHSTSPLFTKDLIGCRIAFLIQRIMENTS